MCVLLLSSFVSVVETTYATHCPSGESCGTRTSRKRARSSNFRGRLAVCPERATASKTITSKTLKGFFEIMVILLYDDQFNAKDAEVFAEDAEENLCVPLRFPLRPLRLRVFSFNL